jgi:hypothetical protein
VPYYPGQDKMKNLYIKPNGCYILFDEIVSAQEVALLELKLYNKQALWNWLHPFYIIRILF